MSKKNIKMLTRPALNRLKAYTPGLSIGEMNEELTQLSSNENPLGVSPLARKAMAQHLSQLNRYPDSNTTRLRETIAKQYNLQPNQVIIGNGADELITLISETFLNEEDEVIIPTPSFSEYDFGANLMGATIIHVSLTKDYQYDLDLILHHVTTKTKIIYLCSPNNPTGTYIKKADLDSFFQKIPQDIIVVFDGAYSQYAIADDYTNGIEYVEMGKKIIVLQTFSKIYGLAGIRVGMGISSSEIVACIHKVREPYNVNQLAQIAAEAAIRDIQHVEASREMNEEGRQYLYRAFEELDVSYIKTMSNFIFVHVGTDAKRIYEKLIHKGVMVRFGGVWGLSHYLRITIGLKSENQLLIAALKEIMNEIDESI
ncbi:histidinol-phosphate transaminase [Polycladospora coralii]|uniref:histidinol-phosphate transaminase n=1 Tax=Polycladospora coralii TaxID=2771432 RepID=UPI0020BD8E73|nr:histidinol-phosphate transaminase [Polycladospora coralii]